MSLRWVALSLAVAGCARQAPGETPAPAPAEDPSAPVPALDGGASREDVAVRPRDAAADGPPTALDATALVATAPAACPAAAGAVTVDFRTHVDPPLVKKFGVMNSGSVPLDRERRDIPRLARLAPHSLRIDLGIGRTGWWAERLVDANAGVLRYDFDAIDELSRLVDQQGASPYWSFCYTPRPLQPDGSSRSPPTDLGKWREAARAFTRHFRDARIHVGHYEVFNEPDYSDFFTGTRDQYLAMYRAAALGMRDGDPDAPIGGPALAFDLAWVGPFVDMVATERLPLDFLSFHAIDVPVSEPPTEQVALGRLARIRAELTRRALATTEIHLTEFHPYKSPQKSGTPELPLATLLLDDLELFLREPDLTVVHWAQLMSQGIGLLAPDGTPRPAFFAYAFYDDLPVARVDARCPAPLRCFAAADDARGGLLVWNRSADPQPLSVRADGLPFARARLEVTTLDDQHRQPVPVTAACPPAAGSVPPHGVVYLRWTNLDAPDPAAPGEVVRVLHHFPRRGGGGYAELDARTFTAYLGQGGDATTPAQVGVLMRGLSPQTAIRVESDAPLPAPATGATVGVRIDFRVGDRFAKAVFLHDGLAGAQASQAPPWGAGGPPELVRVPLTGAPIGTAAMAPAGWDGEAILTFVLQGATPGARLRARVR